MYHSLHVYLHNEAGIDKFLSNDFKRFIEKIEQRISTYCYMRYWLGGPHIRFRFNLLDEDDFEWIESELRSTVQIFVKENPMMLIKKENFYTSEMLMLENIDEDALFWTPHGTVVESNYMPKIELCCQEAVLNDMSQVFYESTVLAQRYLGMPTDVKLSEGLRVLYWSMKTFDINFEEIQIPVDNESVRHSNILETQFKQWASEEMMPSEYVDYFEALKGSLDHSQPLFKKVLISNIHLLFNRMGLSGYQENAIQEALMKTVLG